MITTESCSYYDPCGGPFCQECNATPTSHTTTSASARATVQSPGALLGEFATDMAVVDSDGSSSSSCEAGETLPTDHISAGDPGEFTFIGKAIGRPMHSTKEARDCKLRYVKETKRKRRVCQRPGYARTQAPVFWPDDEPHVVIASDVLEPSPSGGKFSQLSDEPLDGCKFSPRLRGKALSIVRFLSKDLGVKADEELLPTRISCGHLRSAVRGCFPAEVPPLVELSIKTSQKVERSCCAECRPLFDRKLDEWKDSLSQPVVVDEDHLSSFRRAIRANVPPGWNCIPGPYIPNGSATLYHTVKEGGNWNTEPLSDRCRATLVFSSGKPRVVTCYSSGNTAVLTPLHNSLYTMLGRKGWLLVGDPTSDKVAGLNGDGPFLSFDYVGATDNIKSAYVRTAVDVLIEQSVGLGDDERFALRVLSELRLKDVDDVFQRGQPMGSAMSFPLLCLINKTVVDMSLSDLLTAGSIDFNQWVNHRCLINGDDLLTKEPGKKTNLWAAIRRNGGCVGLVVNEEKSMVSYRDAEINSTLFIGSSKEKKTNAKALYMRPDTNDVLGVAYASTRTVRSFVHVVRANARLLARQDDKLLGRLPLSHICACRKDRKIRKAIMSEPLLKRPVLANLFPVSPKPDGYSLTREEEIAIISDRVKAVRSSALELRIASSTRARFKTDVVVKPKSWRSLMKSRVAPGETILTVLERGHFNKVKEKMAREDVWEASDVGIDDLFHDESMYPNKIEHLIHMARSYGTKSISVRMTPYNDIGPADFIALFHIE